jgi:inner membrane protein involved in colicin E2 resistance
MVITINTIKRLQKDGTKWLVKQTLVYRIIYEQCVVYINVRINIEKKMLGSNEKQAWQIYLTINAHFTCKFFYQALLKN